LQATDTGHFLARLLVDEAEQNTLCRMFKLIGFKASLTFRLCSPAPSIAEDLNTFIQVKALPQYVFNFSSPHSLSL
jgi:hypothetical protein